MPPYAIRRLSSGRAAGAVRLALGLAVAAASTLVLSAPGLPAAGGGAGRPPAQAVEPLPVYATLPSGRIGAVAGRGSTVFVGVGGRVVVLDRQRGWPRPLGMTEVVGDDIRSLSTSGDLPIAAAGGAGVLLLDVRLPDAPRSLGVLPGFATAARQAGSLAFVLGGDRLRIYDLATPTAPRQVSVVDSKGLDLVAAGRWLYVTEGDLGLRVLDIGDPAAPRDAARLTFDGPAMDVSVSGTLAVLTEGSFGLRVVDVADPRAPREIGAYAVPDRCGPAGDCLTANRVWAQGDRAWFTLARCEPAFNCRQSPGLRAVSLADPRQPVQLAHLDTRGQAGALHADEGIVYLAETPLWWYAGIAPCSLAPGQLQLLDPDLLLPRAAYRPLTWPAELALKDGHAFVVDALAPLPRGLGVFDLGDPGAPSRVDSPLPVRTVGEAYGMGYATDVSLADSAFVSRGPGRPWSSWSWIEAVEPSLSPANGCSPPPSSRWFDRVVAADGRLYALDAGGLLRVLAEDGAELGALTAVTDTHALAVVAGRVYLANPDGVAIVDAGDPARLEVLGRVPGPAIEVAVEGDLLFVAAGAHGLRTADVSDPAAPVILSTLGLPSSAIDVAVDRGLALVAAGEAGLLRVDVSDPRRPVVTGLADHPSPAFRVALDGGTIVALGRDAITVLGAGLPQSGSPTPPVPTATPTPTSRPVPPALHLPYAQR